MKGTFEQKAAGREGIARKMSGEEHSCSGADLRQKPKVRDQQAARAAGAVSQRIDQKADKTR